MPRTALIVVDVQNDFLPGGALAVPHGDEVVSPINRLIRDRSYALVVATQDWHPPGHGSFASQHPGRRVYEQVELAGLPQTLWPDHCVQDTPGAALAPGLDASGIHRIIRKGTDPAVDSYSGFFDNARRRATGLAEVLRGAGVSRVHVVGLASDYCVKFTALDARHLGFETAVLVHACRGVELRTGDCERAAAEMRAAGCTVYGPAPV